MKFSDAILSQGKGFVFWRDLISSSISASWNYTKQSLKIQKNHSTGIFKCEEKNIMEGFPPAKETGFWGFPGRT